MPGSVAPCEETAIGKVEERRASDVSEAAGFLRIEADAIVQAADRLDAVAFGFAVDLLASCAGKALLLGAGTSGAVARKIAATLTSTGTQALFVHPSDALHGGLGNVTAADVAIAISNSGETDELLVILPYLHSRRVPIIALVGNLDSTLATSATVALDARAAREACPFNLAPTASTAVALALGDALALSVMQAKGLSPEDFAFNHPSGQLGKRLTLRVSDVMHARDLTPTVTPDASWLEVVGAISRGGLGAVPVVDEAGALVGIVTDGDLRRTLERVAATDLAASRARDVMTATPVAVGPAALAYDALRLMEDRPSQISVLPVVDDDGGCAGLVRLHDLVRMGL